MPKYCPVLGNLDEFISGVVKGALDRRCGTGARLQELTRLQEASRSATLHRDLVEETIISFFVLLSVASSSASA